MVMYFKRQNKSYLFNGVFFYIPKFEGNCYYEITELVVKITMILSCQLHGQIYLKRKK